MLEPLKKDVALANQQLVAEGLVVQTWGNVSAIDRDSGIIAIKPSGVPYEQLSGDNIVLVDLSGKRVEAGLNPSSDTETHLVLYRAFPDIVAVVHTHSTHATAFAQAGMPIRCLGTTHADHFDGAIPVIGPLSAEEIAGNYEANTGEAIVRYFQENKLDENRIPACLLPGHGPFSWGKSIEAAVENSIVMEQVARMNLLTLQLRSDASGLPAALHRKHFDRKHGAKATYGQR